MLAALRRSRVAPSPELRVGGRVGARSLGMELMLSLLMRFECSLIVYLWWNG